MNTFFKIIIYIVIFPFIIMYYIFKFTIAFFSKGKKQKNNSRKQQYKRKPVTHNVRNIYSKAVPREAYVNSYNTRKSKKHPSDYVVFDTETTGLEPEIDKIIELSAIKYVNHEKVDEFSYLVNPKMNIDPFITKLTGIKNSDLRDKPYINEVMIKFFDWIEDYTLVAHNASYDIKMLACECYRNNIEMSQNKVIDTVTLARRIFTKEQVPNHKLETIKNYLGLSYNSHRALDDCEVCSAIYQLYCDKNSK